MSLPSINFLHPTVSEIQPGQTFSHRPPTHPPAHPDTMGENNTSTALKGCGAKMITTFLILLTEKICEKHIILNTGLNYWDSQEKDLEQ